MNVLKLINLGFVFYWNFVCWLLWDTGIQNRFRLVPENPAGNRWARADRCYLGYVRCAQGCLSLARIRLARNGSNSLWVRRGSVVRDREALPRLEFCGGSGRQPGFDVGLEAIETDVFPRPVVKPTRAIKISRIII